MTRTARRPDPQLLPIVHLIRHIVGCDERTRRASTLMLVITAAAATLILLVIVALALLGAARFGLVSTVTAVAASGLTLSRRRRK